MIYMDKAATSYHKPEEVAKAVYEAVKATGNSGRGANSASLNSTKMLYDTREKLCKLFNGKDSSRIAFTHNATEALNIVIRGLFKEGDHIIIEYSFFILLFMLFSSFSSISTSNKS